MRWIWLFIISIFIGFLLKGYFNIANWGSLAVLIGLVTAAKYYQLGHEQFRPERKRWWNFSFIAAFSWAFYVYFIQTFGTIDISSLVFHIQFGIEGNGEVKSVNRAFEYLLGVFLFAIAISALANLDSRIRRLELRIGLFLILFNPIWFGVYNYAFGYPSEYKILLSESYVDPKEVHLQSNNKKNLIVIYIESTEKTFSSPQFGDAFSDLNTIIAKSTDLDSIYQVENTGWTIAGMVASQCGIPLIPLGLINRNTFKAVDDFLPGVSCLGDILGSNGYLLSYMGGASLEFSGKGKFYTHHGFERVAGLNELSKNVDGTYINRWGLYDDTLFTQAFNEITSLRESNKPYGMFLLTIAGHSPHGYPSQQCLDEIPRGNNEIYLYSMKCTGYLVNRFVSKLESAGYLENTQLVILSDHLSMKSPQWEKLESMERRNTFFMYPRVQGHEHIQRKASSLDVLPTILEAIGFQLDHNGAAGLGRSLLRNDNQTLVEQYGIGELNKLILADMALRTKIWNKSSD